MHIYGGILHNTGSSLHGGAEKGGRWVKTEWSRGLHLLPSS